LYKILIKKRKLKKGKMKKYLLLIEDEEIWNKFKKIITQDINTEIVELIKKKIKKGVKKDGQDK